MKKSIFSLISVALLLVLSTSAFSQQYAFVLKMGSSGTGDGQFRRPYSVAVDSSDNVYVVDMYNWRIQKFDSDGGFIGWWGLDNTGFTGWHDPGTGTWGYSGEENGQFAGPIDVAVDSADNVYVLDGSDWQFWNNRIQKFSSDGDFITKWGSEGTEDGRFSSPRAVAVDSSDNVYVVDYDQIQKFNSNGDFLGTWGSWGTGDGQFSYPGSITFDSADNGYVVDRHNSRIQMFDSNGDFLGTWGSFGIGDGQFSYPIGAVAVDSADNVFVVDQANNRIQMFDSDGEFIGWWGLDNTGFTGWHDPGTGTWGVMASWPYEDGQFRRPHGVAVDSADNVYVAGDQMMRIQKFSLVIAPQDQIENLIDELHVLADEAGLNKGEANALVSKLDNALKSLEKENTQAACNQLGAFINQVNALINSGRFTQEQGQGLTDAAQSLIGELCE